MIFVFYLFQLRNRFIHDPDHYESQCQLRMIKFDHNSNFPIHWRKLHIFWSSYGRNFSDYLMGASVLEVDGNALQGAVILPDAGFGIKPLFPLSWIYNLIWFPLIFLVLESFCFWANRFLVICQFVSIHFTFNNKNKSTIIFLFCFVKLGRERQECLASLK